MEVLTGSNRQNSCEQAATSDLPRNRIKIGSLNFMHGGTFLNKYIFIDEAQNLTSKPMKTLVTRSGVSTRVVCMGNLQQIAKRGAFATGRLCLRNTVDKWLLIIREK